MYNQGWLVWLGVMVCLCACVVPARAGMMIVEDFEAPGGGPGLDPAFNHFVGPPPVAFFAELTDTMGGPGTPAVPGNFRGYLAPGTNVITFNLPAGMWVDEVSIDAVDYLAPGGSAVMFLGSSGARTLVSTAVDVVETMSSAGLNLGKIQSVELLSFNGTFDNIRIHVVPEPSTWCLGLLAAAVLGWWRRRSLWQPLP